MCFYKDVFVLTWVKVYGEDVTNILVVSNYLR